MPSCHPPFLTLATRAPALSSHTRGSAAPGCEAIAGQRGAGAGTRYKSDPDPQTSYPNLDVRPELLRSMSPLVLSTTLQLPGLGVGTRSLLKVGADCVEIAFREVTPGCNRFSFDDWLRGYSMIGREAVRLLVEGLFDDWLRGCSMIG